MLQMNGKKTGEDAEDTDGGVRLASSFRLLLMIFSGRTLIDCWLIAKGSKMGAALTKLVRALPFVPCS